MRKTYQGMKDKCKEKFEVLGKRELLEVPARGWSLGSEIRLLAANRSRQAYLLKEGLPDSPIPFTPTNKKHGCRR